MTYLGIVLTFGVVFPPLAVVMMAAIVSLIVTNKLVMGRFIRNALQLQVPQYLDAIELDSRGVGHLHLRKLRLAAWMTIWFCCIFHAVFFFDIAGNEVGLSGAFWIFIVFPLMPIGLYVVTKVYRKRFRSRVNLVVERMTSRGSANDSIDMVSIRSDKSLKDLSVANPLACEDTL